MEYEVGDRVISVEDHPQGGNHQYLPGTVVGRNADRAIVQWDDGVSVDEWADTDLLGYEDE